MVFQEVESLLCTWIQASFGLSLANGKLVNVMQGEDQNLYAHWDSLSFIVCGGTLRLPCEWAWASFLGNEKPHEWEP